MAMAEEDKICNTRLSVEKEDDGGCNLLKLEPRLPKMKKKLGERISNGGADEEDDDGWVETWPDLAAIQEEAMVGASRLTLSPLALALPSFSDSPQLFYVLSGSGVMGVVLPGTEEEQVKKVKESDVVALPLGTFLWWHNTHTQHPLCILSLGHTSHSIKPGEFTNIHIMGSRDKTQGGVMHGFSVDFLAQAWDLDEPTVKKLLESQNKSGIVKLDKPLDVEETHGGKNLIYNCEEAKKDVDVKNGGRVVVVTSDNLPLLRDIGLSADLVKLDPGAMCSPGFSADAAFQVTYVVRGSGRVQVVSHQGQRVVDSEIKQGCFFIVPRFHVVSKRAGSDGLEWFSIITTEKPIFSHMGGKTSVWKVLSPDIIRAGFNIDTKLEQHFRSKRLQDAIFFPPEHKNTNGCGL